MMMIKYDIAILLNTFSTIEVFWARDQLVWLLPDLAIAFLSLYIILIYWHIGGAVGLAEKEVNFKCNFIEFEKTEKPFVYQLNLMTIAHFIFVAFIIYTSQYNTYLIAKGFMGGWYNVFILLNDYFIINYYVSTIKIIILLSAATVLLLSNSILSIKHGHLIEFPIIFGLSVFFMLILTSSLNLFGAYVSLEGISFTMYVLAGFNTGSKNSIEAGIKYFTLGAVASGLLLYGISLLFLTTSGIVDFFDMRCFFESFEWNTGFSIQKIAFLLFFSGFLFKLSIFPFHNWTPDVYDGIASIITLFFATVTKLVIFSFFVRFLFVTIPPSLIFFWQPFLLLVSVCSIAVGALGALGEQKIKRFIGFTSINQMGLLLLGVSCGTLEGLRASFIYLFLYLIMTFALFLIILYVREVKGGQSISYITQLSIVGKHNRGVSLLLAIVLFSLAGIPPLVGFFGKYLVFFALFQTKKYTLILGVVLILNLISIFYYIRWIKVLFFEEGLFKQNKHSGVYIFTTNIFIKLLLLFLILIIIFLPVFFNFFFEFNHKLALSCILQEDPRNYIGLYAHFDKLNHLELPQHWWLEKS